LFLNTDGSVAREVFGTIEDFSETYDAPLVELPLELSEGIPNLSGVWAGQGSPYAPPRGITTALTEVGLAASEGYRGGNDPQVFCDIPGQFRLGSNTPHSVRITQLDDRVVFEYEEYGIVHEAFFDPAKAASGIKTHLGDSVARYENGTLIVETTNLLSAMMAGKRLSDQQTLVQTYSRVDEPDNSSLLKIHTLVRDPLNLQEDAEVINIKIASVDYDFIENDCAPPLREREQVNPAMNFFVTSVGLGDGANLGGLAGADAHCAALASTVYQGDKNWRAYLSTTDASGETGVDARDRIGRGPWYNAKGDVVAVDLDDLHGQALGLTKASAVSERGQIINGRGDSPNRHDILTGSQLNGTALNSASDTTCSNWTSNGQGSALVGHADRQSSTDNLSSWNSAHASKGCGQADLQATGGDGLFYCFAIEETD
jgi:hypothetical protein